MPDNLYAPPASAPVPSSQPSRTIPVYVISAWCTIQLAAVAYFMATNWQGVLMPLQMGAESLASFVAKLLFPILLFVAGIQLFLMRKAAAFSFGLYFAWSLQKLLWNPNSGLGPIDVMITTGILVYTIRLHRTGKLN